MLRLLAPTLLARNGLTLGGAAVAPDGTWSPISLDTIANLGGNYAVPAPAASAALVIIGSP